MNKVYVASLSTIKISAVKEVVNELLAGKGVEVQGIHTESSINEQPVGLEGMSTSIFNPSSPASLYSPLILFIHRIIHLLPHLSARSSITFFLPHLLHNVTETLTGANNRVNHAKNQIQDSYP